VRRGSRPGCLRADSPPGSGRNRGLAGIFTKMRPFPASFARLVLLGRRNHPPASRSHKDGKGRACTRSATKWCIHTTERVRS
jgi:hypothetical protein